MESEKEIRSRIMRSVRRENTKPEVRVRKILHSLGYRFRLHVKYLPGSPDIVLPKYRLVIFVHGCFWHRHAGCRYASTPSTRTDYWLPKFQKNIERDMRLEQELVDLGWRVSIIWECETKNLESLRAHIAAMLIHT